MKYYQFVIVLSIFILVKSESNLVAQDYPSFGEEIQVSISGLTFDAMEPFISADGNYLFFNNLNDAINTKLYYATKINDSLFTYIGELNGTNQSVPPMLDAVADMDSLGNFYWTSDLDYPANFDNLHFGTFSDGDVTDIGRVHGDFYVYSPNWILMDHGISFDGEQLYFNNAFFDTCFGPCETYIGVAQKVNDSTFTTLSNSDGILQTINDTNYIYYAPCITEDNLEFYYTRFLKGVTVNTQVEICVAIRENPTDTLSEPIVLFSESVLTIIEAPTLTADKQIMYYHKKVDGIFEIILRYRDISTGISPVSINNSNIKIYPNPMITHTIIEFNNYENERYTITLLDNLGRIVHRITNITSDRVKIDRGNLKAGQYLIQINNGQNIVALKKLMINK